NNSMFQLQSRLTRLNSEKNQVSRQVSGLPEKEQQYLKVDRFLEFNKLQFDELLKKKTDAELYLAGNISDIEILEPAVLVDVKMIGPNKSLNYILALLLPIMAFTLILFVLEILDSRVRTINDIVRRTQIPLVSVLSNGDNYGSSLIVLDNPKSGLAEAFRALRSNVQFLYKKKEDTSNRTVLTTSTIGGEGKTFISMNMATVLSLSGKKTLLIGMDLRKPKIFGDFGIQNDIGLTNYLVGQKTKEEIIQKTKVPSLDIITAGPIPPNPSELLMDKELDQLMEVLKKEYSYIVLDTPPVGLVADAFELMRFTDANLYITRHNYSFRNSLELISKKFEKKEVENIGIILNDFDARGSGYGYGYGYGYFEGDEEYEYEYGGVLEKLKSLFKSRR
ncbi:MAG: polysaccharide biosynthesis tyrosine autokinase, partial [Flavobacteriales bacterium]